MITIQNIIDWSKRHPSCNGRATVIYNSVVGFSIVGGDKGLYGDFVNTFELAILNTETGGYLTKFFYPEGDNDVIAYMSGEKLCKLINKVIKNNDFQVR
jgi:hypothetical protein